MVSTFIKALNLDITQASMGYDANRMGKKKKKNPENITYILMFIAIIWIDIINCKVLLMAQIQ